MGYGGASVGPGYAAKDSTPQWLAEIQEKEKLLTMNRPSTAEGEPQGSVRSLLLNRNKRTAAAPDLAYQDVVGERDRTSRPVTAAVRPAVTQIADDDSDELGDSFDADLNHYVNAMTTRAPATSQRSLPSNAAAQKQQSDARASNGSFSSSLKGSDAKNTFLSENDVISCREIGLMLETTWGDKSYVGLTGIEVLIGRSCIPVTDLNPRDCLSASPWDLTEMGCYDDYRTPDKLLNGINDTTDDRNMWLIPFTVGGRHTVSIDMKSNCKVAGMTVWNYNKSSEDTLRGARKVAVLVDGKVIGRVVLRRGPGCDGVEFGQTIYFRDVLNPSISEAAIVRREVAPHGSGGNNSNLKYIPYISPPVRQDYETPILPAGMLLKISLFTNWGDGYYIGLDGLEVLDGHGIKVDLLRRGAITAVPHSLRDLLSISSDVDDSRIPSNLVSDNLHDPSGCKAWLAPLSVCMTRQERNASGLRVMRRQRGFDKVKHKYEDRKGAGGRNGVGVRYEDGVDVYGREDIDLFSYCPENAVFILLPEPTTISCIRYGKCAVVSAR